MELDKPDFEFIPPTDRRPTIPEPPPVRLVAVEDITLPATAEESSKLDAFYVGLLRFERDAKDDGLVYKAENAKLKFRIVGPDVLREDMRAIGIDVPSLRDLELLLVDKEWPFEKERGIMLGQMTFRLRDPAGNWICLSEILRII